MDAYTRVTVEGIVLGGFGVVASAAYLNTVDGFYQIIFGAFVVLASLAMPHGLPHLRGVGEWTAHEKIEFTAIGLFAVGLVVLSIAYAGGWY